jgi:hypothetical protein
LIDLGDGNDGQHSGGGAANHPDKPSQRPNERDLEPIGKPIDDACADICFGGQMRHPACVMQHEDDDHRRHPHQGRFDVVGERSRCPTEEAVQRRRSGPVADDIRRSRSMTLVRCRTSAANHTKAAAKTTENASIDAISMALDWPCIVKSPHEFRSSRWPTPQVAEASPNGDGPALDRVDCPGCVMSIWETGLSSPF